MTNSRVGIPKHFACQHLLVSPKGVCFAVRLGPQARLLLRAKANVNDSDAKGAGASESVPLEAALAPRWPASAHYFKVLLYCGTLYKL